MSCVKQSLSACPKQPLSSLATESPDIAPCKVKPEKSAWSGGSFVTYLIWFIILWIIIWVILAHTSWVQTYNDLGQPTGVDQWKAALYSFIAALVIVALIWIVRAASGSKHTSGYVC